MGLSRNKVAVSEGAAGSPPFYGDSEPNLTKIKLRTRSQIRTNLDEMCMRLAELWKSFVVQLSGFNYNPIWGCSSVGRAPALQAGGHGFESHHLHHRRKSRRTMVEQNTPSKNNGL